MIHLFFLAASLLGSLLSVAPSPSEDILSGEWGCAGNEFVFTSGRGELPPQADVDAEVRAMGATRHNCVLTFSEGHKLNFRVGEKAFDLDWFLNQKTKEFKTSVGPFTIKGYLLERNGDLLLVYSRSNLFMIMKFLCSPSGRKHIAPLGKLLDCCDGLTLGMTFRKN